MLLKSQSGLSVPAPADGEGAARILGESGFVLMPPTTFERICDVKRAELDVIGRTWERLPRDQYLLDGGHYRSRRHSCLVHELREGALHLAPHRAHWQPKDYNALHGGLQRWFEPIETRVLDAPAWPQVLRTLGQLFAAVRPVERWYIEAHQFRIDTLEGIGRPTPEGAHRDGVDYLAVILVNRHDVRGGETRVFDAHGVAGVRFTLTEPWSVLLLDDARVIHETTPIQPAGDNGVRDTLVLTYRAAGFQSPPAE